MCLSIITTAICPTFVQKMGSYDLSGNLFFIETQGFCWEKGKYSYVGTQSICLLLDLFSS